MKVVKRDMPSQPTTLLRAGPYEYG